MQIIVTYLPENNITCICFRPIWPFFQEEHIIQESNFHSLPTEIKDLSDNPKICKTALKHFLYSQSFYGLDEYFNR
jgi:hypothetical protein